MCKNFTQPLFKKLHNRGCVSSYTTVDGFICSTAGCVRIYTTCVRFYTAGLTVYITMHKLEHDFCRKSTSNWVYEYKNGPSPIFGQIELNTGNCCLCMGPSCVKILNLKSHRKCLKLKSEISYECNNDPSPGLGSLLHSYHGALYHPAM